MWTILGVFFILLIMGVPVAFDVGIASVIYLFSQGEVGTLERYFQFDVVVNTDGVCCSIVSQVVELQCSELDATHGSQN